MSGPSMPTSLTLVEARARAAVVHDVAYAVHLDLRDTEGFTSTSTVDFVCEADATFLELARATGLVVEVDGVRDPAAEAAYDGRRIPLVGLTPGARTRVRVGARLPYVTDGDGMHAMTDPADGERYVSAYTGVDVSQKVLACFDQVDLKAPMTLSVTADPAWTVLANGRTLAAADGRWDFATTPPIPIALFVVCAGPWHSVTWEHAGLPFGWHARASAAADLDRDADELRATTEACFDHYTAMFDEPYAFDSCDAIFVPGLNWGAQEQPGCVIYRDELLPAGAITAPERQRRAMIIAHELSHMWFGNLMTMRWFEDTWLQESFANYMGFRVAEEAAGFAGTWISYEIGSKPGAYRADERRSTHPVAPEAEDVPDVEAALTNFDEISYGKGGAVLRQLVTWLGDDDFLAGVNTHLTRHAFGNADLEDLLEALDGATDRDVRGWAQVWLRQPGFDVIEVTRDGDVPVLVRHGVRPHRLLVHGFSSLGADPVPLWVDLDDEPIRLESLAGLVVVPNAHGETFARVRLDPRSWTAVAEGLSDLDDELARAVLWTTAYDAVLVGSLPVEEFLGLLARHLPRETDAGVVEVLLRRTVETIVPERVPAAGAATVVDTVAAVARDVIAGVPAADPVGVEAGRVLVGVTRDTAELRDWLAGGTGPAGVTLEPPTRWRALQRLAELGVPDLEDLIAAERVRDPSTAGELGAATARAAQPTPEAKAAAWRLAGDPAVSNRMVEALTDGLWSVERPDLTAPYVTAYLAESPGWARDRGAAFAQVLGWCFPRIALDEGQLAELRLALAGDLPTVLRRAWEDRLDDRHPVAGFPG